MDKNKHKPTIAPGDDAVLDEEATKEEKKKGDYTKVVALSYDEVDKS